jgi:flagellar hook-associated protein 2
MQITGLASGLNTNQIISELMAIAQQPVTNLQNQENGLTALNAQLTSIQSSMQTLAADAQALADPSLFANSQTVSSSLPTAITATTSTGAGVGGYQVGVSQLANSAQRTFSYTAPTGNSITIDGHTTATTAGESIQAYVNSINSDSNATVYAAATDSGTVVLSSRATGGLGTTDNTGSDFIQVTNSGGALTEQTTLARAGQDANYTLDGGVTTLSSSSNTVTGAIAGVTLTLSGLTPPSQPATINVSAPAPSSTSITAAVQQFVTDYNSAINGISTQLAQTPSSTDPTQGTLYDDSDLTSLLGTMREAMYASDSTLPPAMASLLDLGVSTGATTGTAAPSASAIAGDLTINATTLANAIQSNPSGVESVLQSFSASFSSIANSEAQPGGTIASRIQGDSSQITDLTSQISNMQASLTDQQAQLTQTYAALEGTLSENQSLASWLTSQISALPTI